MTGLISITHALQTTACYLRLGSAGTEAEQGRPLSQGSALPERPQGRNAPAGRSGRSLLAPATGFTFLPFSPRAADAPAPVSGGLCPLLCQKKGLTPRSSPQSHPQEDPARLLFPRERHGLRITGVQQIIWHPRVACHLFRLSKPERPT